MKRNRSNRNKEKEIPLADHHVHAQTIKVGNEQAARLFGTEVGKIRWDCPPPERYAQHVVRNNLDTIWLIYEDLPHFIKTQKAIEKAEPNCVVNGFYFVRDPLKPNIRQIKTLHKKGYIHGIKLHPVHDSYEFLPKNTDPTIQIAQSLNLPVIYHSDDRKESMHLTKPEYQEEMALTYPQVRFVIGHGGAYAKSRLVGERNTAAQAYWRTRGPLITAALKLVSERENVFYETARIVNRIKATMVAEYIELHPLVAHKILIGTDFPIGSPKVISEIEALRNAGIPDSTLQIIAGNRL